MEISSKKSLFFLFALCFLLFSCKNNKHKELTPITFSLYSADLTEPMDFNDKIANEITKRTGVNLELVPRIGEMSDSITIMIANNKFTDLIYAKGDMNKLIEANAVIPLDDYIEKYGKNIKKLYGDQLVRLRYTMEDPSIYTVGTYEIKSKTLEVSGNMQLQHAVLKEFGYPKIQTLEDYENIIKAYIKKFPRINGHKTIGISLLTDSWYWYLGLSNPGNYIIGFPDDGQWIVDQNTMIATYKFLYPQMDVFYKWLNKIYNEGLLDPESFTQTEEVWKGKLKDGYVLGTTYPFWAFSEIKADLNKKDMQERMMAFLPVTAAENIKDPSLKDYGFSGGWGIAISKDCKDPVRAFQFLDWMCTEEAQILTNWGIENVHYFYDGYKRRIGANSIDTDNDGIGRWVYPFPEGGAGYLDSTGNPLAKLSVENIKKNYSYTEKETLKAYGAELWIDLFPSAQELGISKHGQVWQYPISSQMSERVAQIDEFVKESLINMIIDSPENFDKNWQNMKNHINEMGIEQAAEEINQLIQMKMKLWNQE